MLKIWIGPEMEGKDKGIETLFVQSDTLLDYNKLIQLLRENNVKRVYLGAGRTPYPGMQTDSGEFIFINYCNQNNIRIVIETKPQHLYLLSNFYSSAEIIVSIFSSLLPNTMKLIKGIDFKLDNYKDTIVFNADNKYHTSLDTLNGVTYDCDRIILEEK